MRVMLVDDSIIIQEAVSFALNKNGYCVDVFGDGESAFRNASANKHECIILDLNLPDVNGLTILERLRCENVSTPVLILTVLGTAPQRVNGINLGADDYLPKPFQMAELLARLGAVIRRSNLRTSSCVSA